MSSILTNTSAMTALQTLKGINSNLAKTQDEISTGKSVSSAKDNAAVWAISKVMESDVQGFNAISDSLALGESAVGVARTAAEKVTGLLTQMKTQIVAAQAETGDRTKLQTDIQGFISQIESVVSGAQLSGLNLVNGDTPTMNVLASLDRSGTTVTASNITVSGVDLSTGDYVANDVFAAGAGAATVSANGDTFVMSIDDAGTDSIAIQEGAGGWTAGDKVSITIGNKTASYTVKEADLTTGTTTEDVVALGLKSAIDALGITDLEVAYDSANPGELVFDNQTGNDLSVTGSFKNAGAGGLGELAAIDVSTAGGATAALAAIDGLIQTAVDAAASFGSAQNRIELQADFVSALTDALKTGIGAMVDADMEEASARLQALQVQQQLGVQSLSIANQAPQSILSLFR